MTKSILIFALTLFIGSAVTANSSAVSNNAFSNPSELTQDVKEHEFQSIELDALPRAVKEATEKDGKKVTLESAERKTLPNGEMIYRVTMEVEDKGQVTKSYYANGRKYESK
ncbi:MAG: hypothetical protein EA361_16395 [Bacteroidetes bacterium]|nr:MAG: hypothetical protein EA361_16395 [Bacteroidota bacterium]